MHMNPEQPYTRGGEGVSTSLSYKHLADIKSIYEFTLNYILSRKYKKGHRVPPKLYAVGMRDCIVRREGRKKIRAYSLVAPCDTRHGRYGHTIF